LSFHISSLPTVAILVKISASGQNSKRSFPYSKITSDYTYGRLERERSMLRPYVEAIATLETILSVCDQCALCGQTHFWTFVIRS